MERRDRSDDRGELRAASRRCKLLLDHGAKIDAAEQGKGQTALMWAAAEGHSDVVKLLIARGANVKAASKIGFTPLVFAAVKDDAKSVAALLAAGADPNVALPAAPRR